MTDTLAIPREMPDDLPDNRFGPDHCMQCCYSENICGRCMALLVAKAKGEGYKE